MSARMPKPCATKATTITISTSRSVAPTMINTITTAATEATRIIIERTPDHA